MSGGAGETTSGALSATDSTDKSDGLTPAQKLMLATPGAIYGLARGRNMGGAQSAILAGTAVLGLTAAGLELRRRMLAGTPGPEGYGLGSMGAASAYGAPNATGALFGGTGAAGMTGASGGAPMSFGMGGLSSQQALGAANGKSFADMGAPGLMDWLAKGMKLGGEALSGEGGAGSQQQPSEQQAMPLPPMRGGGAVPKFVPDNLITLPQMLAGDPTAKASLLQMLMKG